MVVARAKALRNVVRCVEVARIARSLHRFETCGVHESGMRRALLALLCFTWMHSRTSVAAAAPVPEPAHPTANKVIVVTIDGSRWQDVVDAGAALPTLARWSSADGALVGANADRPIEATGPNFVSLPGYTEIFAGRRSLCTTNGCARTVQRTIVDDLPTSASFAVVASWPPIALAARATERAGFVSCGRHGWTLGAAPAVDGAARAVADHAAWPGDGDYRPDADTASVALAVVRSARPTFTFVGFGDTDEFAHHGDRAGYLGALGAADRFLGALEQALRETGDDAVTTVLVTADHGRADGFRDHGGAYPESRRVWLVAHGAGVRAHGAVASPSARRLADVAPTVRYLLGMTALGGEAPGAPLSELGLTR